MNELIGNLTDASPPALLAGVLYLLGMYLSRSPLPGWAVPLVLGTLGAVLYPWIADGAKVSYQVRSPLVFNGVMGLLLGLSPTGLHQFFKQREDEQKQDQDQEQGRKPGKTPVWALLALALPLIAAGCKDPEGVAFKTTGTVVVTVDGAMNAWGDYVRAGLASDAQQAQVKSVYEKYYHAVLVEKAAVIAYKSNPSTNTLTAVLGSVTAASAEVIGLIEQFLPADRVLKLKGL